jgi:hypothetical protein
MLKKRIAVGIILLAVSINLVACKSDIDTQENVETTQTNSNDIQGDVLSTGGNFVKILISKSVDTDSDVTMDLDNGEIVVDESIKGERPPIGLAVIDSKDRVNIEEDKVIGSIDYDILDISEFRDLEDAEEVDTIEHLTISTQTILSKFNMEYWSKITGYLTALCDRYHIDITTVESARGLKADESFQYDIIVASTEKYNIYLAINNEDYTAKYSIEEK